MKKLLIIASVLLIFSCKNSEPKQSESIYNDETVLIVNYKLEKQTKATQHNIRLVDNDMSKQMSAWVSLQVLRETRFLEEYKKFEKEKKWQAVDFIPSNRWNIGVLGIGAIGKHVALSLSNFGYNVKGWSRSKKKTAAKVAKPNTIKGPVKVSFSEAISDGLPIAEILPP